MKKKYHPNIVHLSELLQSSTHYYFIMDYCNGGGISYLLSDYKL